MRDHLILLSVPFIRIGRVLLGSPVLNSIQQLADVMIITPYAESPFFQKEFQGERTRFFKWELNVKRSRLDRMLGTIATVQRVNGYWLRFRKNGMGLAYYHHNATYVEQEDCAMKKMPLIKSCLYRLVALTGYFRHTWRIADALRGLLFRDTSGIDAVTSGYHRVTLIQSANWGEQDTYLAWYARKHRLRCILIPYTTDQLYCNGHLLPYKVDICAQGLFEKKCATVLHATRPHRFFQLGSAWFRNVDDMLQGMRDDKNRLHDADVKVILFSGHASLYFPKESEYRALRHLKRIATSGVLGRVKIIYRPVCITAEDVRQVQEMWQADDSIEIQIPQLSIIGLNHEYTQNIKQEWQDYIVQLQKIDVLVMSYISSIALDAAYLGKPTLILLEDPTGKLAKKHLNLQFDAIGEIPCLETFPIIYHLEDMLPLLQDIFSCPESFHYLKHDVQSAWDFSDVDFRSVLGRVIDSSA